MCTNHMHEIKLKLNLQLNSVVTLLVHIMLGLSFFQEFLIRPVGMCDDGMRMLLLSDSFVTLSHLRSKVKYNSATNVI